MHKHTCLAVKKGREKRKKKEQREGR